MQKSLQSIFFVIVVFISINGNSQLLAPYANLADTVNSNLPKGPDSLFVFNVENDSTFIIVDTHKYDVSYTREWQEYQGVGGFVTMATTEDKILFTPDSIAIGYRLILSNGSVFDTMTCWVAKNDFEIEITSEDHGDTLSVNSYQQCDRIIFIETSFKKAIIKYFDYEQDSGLYYTPRYNFEWEKELEADDGNVSADNAIYNLDIFKTYSINKPHWQGMYYTHIVSDNAGLEKKDSTYVRSITPKAEFSKPEPIKLYDEDYYPDKSDAYYEIYGSDYEGILDEASAPTLYPFDASGSKNAQTYKWFFGDTSKILTTSDDTVIHRYNYWGDFEPYLVAVHSATFMNQVCVDTFKLEEPISIDAPKLKVPNVFSPPGGINPIWRFSDVSITDFEIKIYSRVGINVHSFKGNIRDWEGWDGRFRNNSRVVSTGVYFYIVKTYSVVPYFGSDERGKENIVFTKDQTENTEYRGFIHLFNTEQ